jgi:hypothetical protein
MSEKHCKTCINVGTAYCKECMVIENSKGESPPSNFVSDCAEDPRYLENLRANDLAALIIRRIELRSCVPLRWLVEYNMLVAREKTEDYWDEGT